MANNDNEQKDLSEQSGQAEKISGLAVDLDDQTSTASNASAAKVSNEDAPSSVSSAGTSTHADSLDGKSTAVTADETSGPVGTARPSLVQLGSGNHQGSTHVAPQPKRFSAVNINKKFLEKASSSSGSTPATPSLTSTKSGGPVSRPLSQSSTSHSRLVTTKLTATPQPSITTGPGWSRPSSATPPVAANSTTAPNGTSLAPTPLQSTSSAYSSAAPQLPVAGKVILPQSRGGLAQTGKEGLPSTNTSKPVWGNAKALPGASRLDSRVQNDFPTAAEVAQVSSSPARKPKQHEESKTAELAAASKQARMEEADTFRGVHLDPNAHHWDEMEEDDDNFLDGVLEFGDGRQYKIESNDPPTRSPPRSSSSPPRASSRSRSGLRENATTNPPVAIPVSKEERFADDNYDRSWPRSRTSPAMPPRDFASAVSGHPGSVGSATQTASPISPTVTSSPQESPRVLFNERSNRLEPYGSSHRGGAQGPPPPPFHSKRSNDFPPQDPRVGHPPGHSGGNVQLLQKPGFGDAPPQLLGLGGGPGQGPHDRQREREPPRRDGVFASHPPPSPGHHRNDLEKERELSGGERGRRMSNMGPPPLPHTMRGPGGKDIVRQMPPHLALSPNDQSRPLPDRISPRDSRFPPNSGGPPPSPGARFARHPSQSPALSHTSAAAIVASPVLETKSPLLSAPQLDEMRKDVMHSAAARAKQRRLEEETERENQKERAKRKAAELEERFKAVEAEKQKQQQAVESIIEEAVKSAEPPQLEIAAAVPAIVRTSSKPPLHRPPSLRGLPLNAAETSRPLLTRRPSGSSAAPLPSPVVPPAAAAESWRSKAGPMPSIVPRQAHPRPRAPSFPPAPSALAEIRALAEDPEAELEVVDFSDMGKFLGVPEDVVKETPAETKPSSLPPRPTRAVASDFFDDDQPSTQAAGTTIAPKDQHDSSSLPVSPAVQEHVNGHSALPRTHAAQENPSVPDLEHTSSSKEAVSVGDHDQTVIVPSSSSQSASQKTPRNQTFYKEAAMSALDDVMSRIKGALDVMHEKDTHSSEPEIPATRSSLAVPGPSLAKPSPQKERWVPPALRSRDSDIEPREVFLTTCGERPRSPKPAWNTFTVRIPKVNSKPLEPLNKKQLFQLNKFLPVRWDILSFDPPVEGMSRRDFSVNDVLFRKPGYKGKNKYRVALPRTPRGVPTGPRVNIPPQSPTNSKVNGVGAFGRPTVADGASTWRKQPMSSAKPDLVVSKSGLDTTSRSPPPEISSTPNDTSIPPLDLSASTKDDLSAASARSKPQPKMPLGSAVAYYRDSRVVEVAPAPNTLVSFIVTSELEESSSSLQAPPATKQQSAAAASASLSSLRLNEFTPSGTNQSSIGNGVKPSSAVPEYATLSSTPSSKSDSKSSDDLTAPIAPSHRTATWASSSMSHPVKDSLARGPDPEHLKAVWSQTSNKAGLHAVNSLEGIADDLTALPFTLQDVKSEDGGTPPPSVSTAPSRMSLHDVTRAFQQVPTSSSPATAQRAQQPISPPHTSAPVARPPNASYGYPLHAAPSAPNIRTAYASYPSPMLAHSPSTPVMYPLPSPIPSRMQVNGGQTPMYAQPMWMPLPPGTPTQNHGGMMRPIASPYPPQMMHYPSPGGAPQPMYLSHPPPPPMGNPAQQQNGIIPPNRGGHNVNMAMMSPILQHSAHHVHPHPHPGMPMYAHAGSPVLMHARGAMPGGNGNNGHPQPPQQHPQTPIGHQPHPGPYSPLPPPAAYARPW